MQLLNIFIEKWHICKERRYPVMFIIPSKWEILTEQMVDEFAGIMNGKSIDFAARYQGALDTFLTRSMLQRELLELSQSSPVIVSNLEPFYSKWQTGERLDFIRYMLRTEMPNGVVIVLYCQENLADIRAIDPNNRGYIWALG
ncbi:MAG: hypothetical protein HQK69_08450 [Desulfamplus sp.]|nr:hypothetical protein [Desulfamplus sp.]